MAIVHFGKLVNNNNIARNNGHKFRFSEICSLEKYQNPVRTLTMIATIKKRKNRRISSNVPIPSQQHHCLVSIDLVLPTKSILKAFVWTV